MANNNREEFICEARGLAWCNTKNGDVVAIARPTSGRFQTRWFIFNLPAGQGGAEYFIDKLKLIYNNDEDGRVISTPFPCELDIISHSGRVYYDFVSICGQHK